MIKSDPLIERKLSAIKKNILATLAYFDVFDYPLTQGEIFLFLTERYELQEFTTALESLRISRTIFRFDRFYTLKNNQYLAERRRQGNAKAAELVKTAERVAKLLIRFPYVRGIAISGSLSKNYADEHSDVDLFIITEANRLWIARSFLHLFKKITFLFGKQHLFCMNYFIDESELQIAEKNIYTATEIVTLIPLEGDVVFEQFYTANSWIRGYLPNNIMRLSRAEPVKKAFFKNVAEMMFNNKAGEVIEGKLMNITAARWQKKAEMKQCNMKGGLMGMSTGKHVAKPDPRNFQEKLIGRYENKVFNLLREYDSSLVH